MFGKKSRKNATPNPPTEESAQKPNSDTRLHSESLGDVWLAITGMNPATLLPQVIGTVLHEGGTRPSWKWQTGDNEFIVMAWPQDQPIRASVLMGGPIDGELKPITAVPLAQGLPNDLTVEDVHPRQEGMGGDVAVTMFEGKNPMWFFDPMFDRDKTDLTPGVTSTFWLAGIAFAVRKALLDEITITNGPQYEAYAASWLANNPGSKSQDVPPLKMDIKGKHFIMPGRFFGEYQLRAVIDKIQDCQLEKMPIKLLYLTFPFENRPELHLPLYVSQFVLKDLVPEEGKEIEAYVWLQGRVIDLEAPEQTEKQES